MNKYVLIVLSIIVVLAAGYAIGRYVQPSKIITEVREVVKEVVKEVMNKDIITVIKERILPDGTQEKETTIIDKSTYEKEQAKEQYKEEIKIVENKKHDWQVRAIVQNDGFNQFIPKYGGGIERRVIGPVFAGVQYVQDQNIGLSVSVEF